MQASESVRKNFEVTVKALKYNGYKVVECDPFGDIEIVNTKHRKLIAAEFALNHHALYSRFSALYSSHSKELYAQGLQVHRSELEELKEARIAFREQLNNGMHLNKIDFWLSPSTTTTAPLGLASTGSPLMSLPWTNAGLPSITVPNGFDANGLPFGLQIIGGWNQDEHLTLIPNLLESLQ